MKTRSTPGDAGSDIHRGFGDTLDPYMLAGAENHAVKERVQLVDEEWIQTL